MKQIPSSSYKEFKKECSTKEWEVYEPRIVDLLEKLDKVQSLKIDRLLIVYPGEKSWPVSETISVYPISKAIKFLVGLTKGTE